MCQDRNPASQRCAAGGKTHRADPIDGHGQFGVCVFEENRQCEEWALFRVHCQTGGVNVTGYSASAGRYCAITGGRYPVTQHSGARMKPASASRRMARGARRRPTRSEFATELLKNDKARGNDAN
ncbi:DUF333 domain-containing protein [Nitrospira sp. KM1]|uniref:DUF333 domain-containing protein n=1 Tax=Nitrospira sp. KM1 TaxID=1936990 RepID=UPI0015640774